jgi:hypothetical protein
MAERMRIIKQAIYLDSLSHRRAAEEGSTLHALATSFAYALESIPTHHLEECFRRAIQSNTSDWPLTAAAVLRSYQDLIPELQRQAQQHANAQERLLIEGHGSLGYMGLEEWKQKHNLPPAWRLGMPYPPESDLSGKPLPRKAVEYYNCAECKDARWLKKYGKEGPFLVPCPKCG